MPWLLMLCVSSHALLLPVGVCRPSGVQGADALRGARLQQCAALAPVLRPSFAPCMALCGLAPCLTFIRTLYGPVWPRALSDLHSRPAWPWAL